MVLFFSVREEQKRGNRLSKNKENFFSPLGSFLTSFGG